MNAANTSQISAPMFFRLKLLLNFALFLFSYFSFAIFCRCRCCCDSALHWINISSNIIDVMTSFVCFHEKKKLKVNKANIMWNGLSGAGGIRIHGFTTMNHINFECLCFVEKCAPQYILLSSWICVCVCWKVDRWGLVNYGDR